MANDITALCDQLQMIASSLQSVGTARFCGCTPAFALPPANDGYQATDQTPQRTSHASAVHKPSDDTARSSGLAFVEAVLAARARRHTLLDPDLLFDPAWSMLIDLYRAALLGKPLSVTAVMIGSGVPDTTALRYLRILEERGYVERFPDKNDRRRIYVRLSPQKFTAMADYFTSTHAALLAQTA